jgi:predicted MPP superfamily phosphohydrolase
LIKLKTAVVVSDIHAPYQDDVAISVAQKITKDLQPDIFVANGDIVDGYPISRFLKDPNRLEGLQDELNSAKKILAGFRDASPKSKRYMTEGNHEARLHKTIATLDGPARELARLDNFQEAMSWRSLLNLHILGYHWIGESDQPAIDLIPHVLIKHGSVVRKFSGYTAKGEYDNYHRSGTSGHTHRLSQYFHTSLGETHLWIETGCLCVLKPDYIRYPNWAHGFAVFTWVGNEHPHVELVHINKGKTIFRGNIYKG